MAIMTIRMPDERHERLREMARQRGVSINKLVEELTTVALAEFDTETHFRARAARGKPEEGLRLLDKLEDQRGALW